jgi:hypothetical protein
VAYRQLCASAATRKAGLAAFEIIEPGLPEATADAAPAEHLSRKRGRTAV